MKKELTEHHNYVLELIQVFQPITVKKLETRTGISGRQIRDIVQDLRIFQEEPIAICRKGYFIAETVEEMQHTANILYTQAISRLQISDQLKRNIQKRDKNCKEYEFYQKTGALAKGLLEYQKEVIMKNLEMETKT
jgi:predicted transcriptional regulator